MNIADLEKERLKKYWPELFRDEYELVIPVCLTYKGGFHCNFDKCKVERCLFARGG